jgi:4-amino-4-deoxy-L-arabinose transferase-like glycosyltransferase
LNAPSFIAGVRGRHSRAAAWLSTCFRVGRGSTIAVALLVTLLAFGFLGSRGIWDPDEGRYTNVALTMLDSGDWLNPRRNEDVGHWTKPPLTYWAIAASVAAFGQNPWAARLPWALSYLCCVWLAWRVARRLAPGTEATAAIAYATMLLPFGAANVITTDYILAATQTLAVYAFIEARFGIPTHARRWWWLMWMAYAAAFMAKGPPALLPLLSMLALHWLAPRPGPRRWWPLLAGVALFFALALPWYAVVTFEHDGLLRYFLGAEVIDRIASNRFDRNGSWYGWLKVYGPTLLLGTLPWTPALWRWGCGLRARLRGWRTLDGRRAGAAELFLVLWVALPLLVFCMSRSRLPLYLLPLFVPLAVMVALQRHREGLALPDRRRMAIWAIVLLGLRLATSLFPTHKDAAAWTEAIRTRSPVVPTEVVFVDDMARYGLHLHLDAEIEKVSLRPVVEPSRFNPVFDEALNEELVDTGEEPGMVFVTKQARWPRLRDRISTMGYRATALGTPYQRRVIFTVRPHKGGSPQRMFPRHPTSSGFR